MAKISQCHLKPNPFKTYRDPQTGLWIVLIASSANHPVTLQGDNQSKLKAGFKG